MTKKFIYILTGILLLKSAVIYGSNVPYDLRCNGVREPLGVEDPMPDLKWLILNDYSGKVHDAWQVQAATSKEKLLAGKADLWDSKWKPYASSERLYRGKVLKSYDRCYWRVRTRTEDGQVTAWSEPTFWQMGVINKSDWRGAWIGYKELLPGIDPEAPTARDLSLSAAWIWAVAQPDDAKQKIVTRVGPRGVRYTFSKKFNYKDKTSPSWAILRIAIDGIATQVRINGKLADIVTSSGAFNSSSWTLPVDVDVRAYIQAGDNEIEINVLHWSPERAFGFKAVLAIKDSNGDVQKIRTNKSWKTKHVATGEIRETQQKKVDFLTLERNHDFSWGQKYVTPILRRTFTIDKEIASATLSVSGLGCYELNLNGERVGNRLLDPAFTNYNKRVLYSTYDLTNTLKKGDNAFGILLGNGFYNQISQELFNMDQAAWRDIPKAILQLKIDYKDGTTKWIVSDKNWKASQSAVVYNGVRNGQVYDARMEQQGWDTPAFDDADWSSVDLLDAPKGKLASTNMPPEREIDVMEATEITETFKHSFIFKFPKNTSGWPRLNVSGPKGTRVVLRSFEAFDNRNFGHINKQGTYQTDTYILKGEGVEIFEPSLTYHGFQYVEVIGYPGEPTRESVKAVVVHTDLEQVGTFECSSELLNDIQDMTTNSYLTNYQGLPLDCPTREKGGWTADGYLAAETGLLNFDAYTSHSKWVDDMLDCQHTDGRVPDIVPTDAWGYNGHFDWDCVIIYMPWYDYLYTGNREILTRSYEGMKACYDHYFAKAEDGILDDGRGDHAPFLTPTPTTVTVTAILSDCAHIIAKIAKLTGNKNDAKAYHQKAEYVKNAFLKKHLVANGTVANGSITAQSCALYYNLVPEDQKYAVVSKLVEAVHKANDHVDFGIFGAKYAFSVLSENGYHNLACTMVLQRTFPGYGWWVERGLTAQAENWDCRTDLNHIMFGDISAWFYRHLGGIKPKIESPGFKDFILEPRTDKRLDFVNSEHKSPYGLIVSNWKREGDLVEYHFTIPVNTTAHIILEGEPINSKSLIKGNSGKYEQYVGGGSYVFKMQQ